MKTVRRLRLVALVEWSKAVLVLFAVVGLLALGGDGLRRLAMALIDHFHLNPANHPARMLVYVTDGAGADLHWVIAIALAYVALRVAEGWGLWAGRAWAVVVGLVSVALYLPVELWHLWRSPDLPGVALLAINLLLLALLWPRGGRGHRHLT
jgi:uncharacterized membrane protein (DUF2068 family)